MRKIFFLLFIVVWQLSSVFAADVAGLRRLYYEAASERSSANKFMQTMKALPVESDPLLLCFKGMAHMIQANYSFNPYNKLSLFTKGKEMLERSVKMDPQNVEIRFMRFCVQTNAPFFLGYSSEVNLDKILILNSWSKITDEDLKNKIRNYMMESEFCTKSEKSLLK